MMEKDNPEKNIPEGNASVSENEKKVTAEPKRSSVSASKTEKSSVSAKKATSSTVTVKKVSSATASGKKSNSATVKKAAISGQEVKKSDTSTAAVKKAGTSVATTKKAGSISGTAKKPSTAVAGKKTSSATASVKKTVAKKPGSTGKTVVKKSTKKKKSTFKKYVDLAIAKLKNIDWKALGLKIVMSIWSALKRFGLGFWKALKHIPYYLHVTIHPFDGFFRLKNEERRRSIPCAVIVYALLAISAILNKQLLGYVFADQTAQLNLNVISEIISALLPYMLWVVANWCFTSLMDGSGKLSDIFCATAVAVIPVIVCNLLLIPISNLISLEDIAIFEFIQGFGQVFTWALMFVGMMITHQYTVLKAIATTLLTILGMAIIGFVIVLVMYLIQQLVGFVSSLTTEISFRMNE